MQNRRAPFGRVVGILATIAFIFSLVINTTPAYAASVLILTIVGNPNNTQVDVGQTITYDISFSCNSDTGDCGQLNISDTLPPELQIISVNAPPTAQGYVT